MARQQSVCTRRLPPVSNLSLRRFRVGNEGTKAKFLLGMGLVAGGVGGFTLLRRRTVVDRPSILSSALDGLSTAAITGASSGIGAAFARQLAPLGFNLVLVARREDRLSALATELQAHYPIKAEVLAADLADATDIKRVQSHLAELDNLDILINNAGFGAPGSFAEAEPDPQLNMIQVHVIASVHLTRAALPGMIARGQGAIINVSSIAGLVPIPGSATYSSTKAYLVFFSEALQAELRGSGIKVQALCPGFTHTGFHDAPEHKGFHRSRIPEALWMSAQEVAEQSLRALDRRQVVFAPGFKNQVLAIGARNVPRSLLHLLRSKRT
jgi:short-subunit dehydrogenase